MTRIKHFIFPLIACALASCELETSGNGGLDGYWHLEQVDTLATGGVTDLSEDYRFWAFQYRLLNVSGYNSSYLLRFSHEGDSLFLSDPYVNDRKNGDIQLEDQEPPRTYGINGLTERFRIEQLKGTNMVLSNKTLKLRLKKF